MLDHDGCDDVDIACIFHRRHDTGAIISLGCLFHFVGDVDIHCLSSFSAIVLVWFRWWILVVLGKVETIQTIAPHSFQRQDKKYFLERTSARCG